MAESRQGVGGGPEGRGAAFLGWAEDLGYSECGIYCIIYNVQNGEMHHSLSLDTPLSYPRPSGLRWMSWEVSTMVPPMMAFKMP